LKDLGDVLQVAGADAIGPLLVFLNLSECQPEGVRDIGLAHIEHEPPHAQAAADIDRKNWPRSAVGGGGYIGSGPCLLGEQAQPMFD
jgi:hypothetical protein